MNKTIKNFKNLGERYNFPVVESNNNLTLTAKTTHDNMFHWIKYDIDTDTVYLLGGNTDQCCIWLCDTRKDFTPEKTVQFVNDLNAVFELKDDKFKIKELIDPEDWQVIAGVRDAYEDERYLQ